MNLPAPLEIIIEELNKLPSVGKKTAQRISLHLLRNNDAQIDSLIRALQSLKEDLSFCSECFNIAVGDKCEICKNPKRDVSLLCVVEDISDVIAIERTHEFNGLYHILGGVLSPLSGKSVDSIRINELLQRISKKEFKEIILALNPDTEGETTSLYIAKQLKPYNIKISRIARGLPVGGNLEFADEATIGRAVLSRTIIQ